MHPIVARVVLGALVPIGVGCKANLPALTDANAALDATCRGPHADLLVDFFPTSLTNASAALGAPDGSSVVLTTDGVITVGFVGLGGVTNAPGNDLRIHATVAPGASATVRLASSDMQFRYAGDLTASVNEVDVGASEITSAVYVRIIDLSGTIEIDALEATHDTCP